MGDPFLYPALRLDDELVRNLRRSNPWWEGAPMRALPATRRHLVRQIQSRLAARLAPIVVVRGPRQIGKTTAQLQVLADLLESGVDGRSILRVQADELPALSGLKEPILRIADWYEANVLGCTLNEAAKAGRPTYLFLDEVQNLPAWAPQLKFLVDTSTTQVVVSGKLIGFHGWQLAGRASVLDAEASE